jgi:hypothetical protein
MSHKTNEHAKYPNHTKSGPGRYHAQGDGSHQHLTLEQRKAGAYGKGLRNWITNKQAAAAA